MPKSATTPSVTTISSRAGMNPLPLGGVGVFLFMRSFLNLSFRNYASACRAALKQYLCKIAHISKIIQA
jgi:hypothetical protein